MLFKLVVSALLHERLLEALDQEVLAEVRDTVLRVALGLDCTQILAPLLVEGRTLVKDVLEDGSERESVVSASTHEERPLLKLLKV